MGWLWVLTDAPFQFPNAQRREQQSFCPDKSNALRWLSRHPLGSPCPPGVCNWFHYSSQKHYACNV